MELTVTKMRRYEAKKEKSFRDQAREYAQLLKLKADKEKHEQLQLEMKLRQEENLNILREKERQEKIKESKTKPFFEINKFNRKVPAIDSPVYFGDMITNSTAWIPHGKGQFTLNGKVKMEGEYRKGEFVSGIIHFENGYTWEGLVVGSKMHGVGVITKHTIVEVESENDDETHTDDGHSESSAATAPHHNNRVVTVRDSDIRRAAIAFNNLVLCYQDELVPGLQVQFMEPLRNIYSGNRNPIAVITKLVRNWEYMCRFNEEVWPKERLIDFATIPQFKLLHHLPRIYNFSSFGLNSEAHKVYDYRPQSPNISSGSQKDSSHNRSVEEQINRRALQLNLRGDNCEASIDSRLALSRSSTSTSLASFRAEQLPHLQPTYYNKRLISDFPLRKPNEKRTNMFESRMVGIGAAQEEEDAEKMQELRKKQWAALIADKRAAQDVARQKEIEDQQNVALQQAVAQQKKLGDQKRQEEAEYAEATRKAVAEELENLSHHSSPLHK